MEVAYYVGISSARNVNLEVPVYKILKAKQGYTVRKVRKNRWI
jgi:hypothetical protein